MVEPVGALEDRADDLRGISETTGGRVVVGHVPFLSQVDLRLDPSQVGRAPYPLPLTPNTAWEEGARAALWLGPNEWLVLGPPSAGPEIVDELHAAVGELHSSIVDVSAARAVLELSGAGANELLSKGCSLDLHPRVWGAGMCAQTLLAGVPVVFHQRTSATGVLVRPSFADYLVDWLLVSTR